MKINFPPKINIGDSIYNLISIQRGELSAIYKSTDTFLRIGQKEKISKDLAFHKEMESLGFPVPKLLEEGEYEDMSYFTEQSLGEKCFGIVFKEETEQFGKIQDSTFEQFIESCMRLAEVQLKTATQQQDWEKFEKGIHLDLICQELPDLAEKITGKVKFLEKKLAHFPFAMSHGDFTPFNVYPKGIIDFEDTFMAPCLYDSVAMMEILNWFPKPGDYEFYQLFQYSPEQKHDYMRILDEIYKQQNLPTPSEFLSDIDLAKGIWFTVNIHKLPKLQKFRYDIMNRIFK